MGVKNNPNKIFQPQKLREAREVRGLTVRDLAQDVGLGSHQALSKYENGKSLPPADVLMKIMRVLDLPYSYFFDERIREEVGGIVYFRSRANATAKLKKIHKIKVAWLMKLYNYFEGFLDFPESDLFETQFNRNGMFTPTHYDEIEKIASNLRRHWNLNNGPITDITHLFEKHGIVVSIISGEDISIDACSKWVGNKLFIIVGNDRAVPSRIKFSLAHELGHYLIHKHVKEEEFNKKDVYKRMEDEANHFASSFLLPAQTFSDELVSTSLDYYRLLKERWQVSMQMMIYRSRELDIINEHQSAYLWKLIARKGWRIKEPNDEVLLKESPSILKEAVNLLVDNDVRTKKQLYEEIKLNKRDIEALTGLPMGYFDESEERGKIVSFKRR